MLVETEVSPEDVEAMLKKHVKANKAMSMTEE